MTQTIVNLGTGGAVLNGQNGSTSGADSNDALFLDWPGDNAGNYVYVSGVNSSFLSVPDQAALDITGDIDIRVFAALDSWTLTGYQYLIAKYGGPGARSFRIFFDPSSRFVFAWSADGTNDNNAVFTNPGIAAGTAKWIRFTLDVNNGAGGYTAKAFTSDDGVTWTQFDTDKTGAGVTSIFNSAAGVSVPGAENGSSLLAGKFYRTQIFNGIGGTKVLDIDTSAITSGAATSLAALTGQTVTINRSTAGRKAVAVVSPVWLFGTDDYIEVADNNLIDFGASDSFTVLAVIRQWTSAGGRVASKALNPPNYYIDNDAGKFRVLGRDGTNTIVASSAAWTSGLLNVLTGTLNRNTNSFSLNLNGATTSVSSTGLGSMVNSDPLTIGAAGSGAGYNDMELVAFAVYRRALTATEISQITAYYQARLS